MNQQNEMQRLINEQRKLLNENLGLREQLLKKERQINELFHQMSKLSDEVQEVCFQLLSSVSIAMEMRDGFARDFAERTAEYGAKVGEKMGLQSAEIDVIRRAGYLLEIGRIGLKGDVFTKIGKLSETEYETIKSHTTLGHDILKPIKFLKGIVPIVRHHHERYDGRGYPDGLGGEQIPIGSRILAVVSTFIAMTQHRPHRKALNTDQAEIELRGGSGSQFDPQVVEAFIAILEEENTEAPPPDPYK